MHTTSSSLNNDFQSHHLTPQGMTSQALTAQWISVDGKLVCNWHPENRPTLGITDQTGATATKGNNVIHLILESAA